MPVSVREISPANPWFTDLLEQIQAGGEIVFTRQGKKIARLLPVEPEIVSPQNRRRALIARLQQSVANKIQPGPDAAHSQDFLYDENGLPQ